MFKIPTDRILRHLTVSKILPTTSENPSGNFCLKICPLASSSVEKNTILNNFMFFLNISGNFKSLCIFSSSKIFVTYGKPAMQVVLTCFVDRCCQFLSEILG